MNRLRRPLLKHGIMSNTPRDLEPPPRRDRTSTSPSGTATGDISAREPFQGCTSPPRLTGLKQLKSAALEQASKIVLPLLPQTARSYVGGVTVEDAMCVANRLAAEDFPSTLGFWNKDDCTSRQAADINLAAVAQIAQTGLDSYVSIKPPALQFDRGLVAELAAAAGNSGVRLHCDSHGTEVADLSHGMVETMLETLPSAQLGTTLPGRWRRSLSDADWAVERQLSVRVVKGQWPDPVDPDRDLRTGFLEAIDRLAGRARHVAVATHDAPLAIEAVTRLRAAGTSCEIEQIYGMASGQMLHAAHERGVRVRIYVPFGEGYMPNAIRALLRNPRLILRIAKGLVSN
jgi:proline dehydrogenase